MPAREKDAPSEAINPQNPQLAVEMAREGIQTPAAQHLLMFLGTVVAVIVGRAVGGPAAAREAFYQGLRTANVVTQLAAVPEDRRSDPELLKGILSQRPMPAPEAPEEQAPGPNEDNHRRQILAATVRQQAAAQQGLIGARKDLIDLQGGDPQEVAAILVTIGYLRWAPGSIPGFTGTLVPGAAFPGGPDQAGRIYHVEEIPLLLAGFIARLDEQLRRGLPLARVGQ